MLAGLGWALLAGCQRGELHGARQRTHGHMLLVHLLQRRHAAAYALSPAACGRRARPVRRRYYHRRYRGRRVSSKRRTWRGGRGPAGKQTVHSNPRPWIVPRSPATRVGCCCEA